MDELASWVADQPAAALWGMIVILLLGIGVIVAGRVARSSRGKDYSADDSSGGMNKNAKVSKIELSQPKLVGLATIRSRAKAMAERLGEPTFELRSQPMHDGSHHVEISDAYYLITTERGQELHRRRTTDVDELLYWLMGSLTSSMSWSYELAHRRVSEDSRRQAFAKQVELLSTLSSEWAERRQKEQADILERHPFHDR